MWYRFSQEYGEEEKFAEYLSQKYGASVRLYLTQKRDLLLHHLEVPKDKRKQGIGSAIMREITDFADDHGFRLVLKTAVKNPDFGTTSSGRLKKFYKRFDFLENKNRNKDFTISENMYRKPRKVKQEWPLIKPGTAPLPPGTVRRFHYTDSLESLKSIAKHGLLLDRSESWKYGDPKAIWSSPRQISDKWQIEFWEYPENIISDIYQFKNVLPNQILALHEPWHKLYFLLTEDHSPEQIISKLEDLDLQNVGEYKDVYEYIKKNKKNETNEEENSS